MVAALVDSDVLIEVARANQPVLERWLHISSSGFAIALSTVSVAELWHGARRGEEEYLRRMFAGMSCLPVEEQIGEAAGALLRRYSKSHGTGLADALIAATAIFHDIPLWTRNRRHFPMPEVRFF